MSHFHWQLCSPLPQDKKEANLPPLLLQLLHNRGLTQPATMEPFLAVDERLLHDPFLLPDLPRALPRIYQALLQGEKVAVYGDFDADGLTATATLVEGLSLLGMQPVHYIPHRIKEGHGLHAAALRSLREQGVSLVITVDCGMNAQEAVAEAQALGQDIIITDHHVAQSIPPALAVINPGRPDSSYPFTGLTGVGVALKLVQALLAGAGRDRAWQPFLDLAALGTVADMAPLLDENRFLAKHGLELLRKGQRPGVRELLLQAGLRPSSIEAKDISYVLAPRLNAAGRVDHASLSYQLLATTSPHEALELATTLERQNEERQKLTDEGLTKAKEQVLAGDPQAPLLWVCDEDFWAGVTGIVAGQLVQLFHRPCVVVKVDGEEGHGSARSIPEFNIIEALAECQGLLSRFGGHPQAAGFTLPTSNLVRLQHQLIDIATRSLAQQDLQPKLLIDAELPLEHLDGQTFPLLQRLAPFGKGNPSPTFLSRRVELLSCRRVGNQGEHLRLKLKQNSRIWQGVAFDLSEHTGVMPPLLDVVYQLAVDSWTGQDLLELHILDFRAAAP